MENAKIIRWIKFVNFMSNTIEHYPQGFKTRSRRFAAGFYDLEGANAFYFA